MAISLAEAKALKPGDILIDINNRRWKVNGKVKTWKRDANRIHIPLKHGLYAYDSLNYYNFHDGVCYLVTKEGQ